MTAAVPTGDGDVDLPSLTGLSHHQVLQRQSDGGCRVRVESRDGDLTALGGNGEIVSTSLNGSLWLPTGGPYDIVELEASGESTTVVTDVLVGDLWVMAGQSNMAGAAPLADREMPGTTVRAFDMAGRWRPAHEPLHVPSRSQHNIHRVLAQNWETEQQPGTEGHTSAQSQPWTADPSRTSSVGVGPGVAFANEVSRRTGVPVGLVPTAHGGTSLSQWSAEEPDGLFEAMLASARAAGSRIAGVLWYQGESDCDPRTPFTYDDELRTVLRGLREALSDSRPQILLVQLGRFGLPVHSTHLDTRWSRLREVQRLCSEADGIVATVDLALIDPIHLGTSAQVRLGRRLGRLAAQGPRLDLADVRVHSAGHVIDVTFTGVIGGLRAGSRPAGFSVRNSEGEDQKLVYDVELLDCSARLRLGRAVEPGEQLWYGYGLDPYCNIVDGEDMSLPAFGPIPLVV